MRATSILSSALAVAGSAFAQTTYDVSAPGDNVVYKPDTLENVQPGDMIRVTFSTLHHDIVSGSFGEPCVYNQAGGVNSGIYENGEVFIFTINSTEPQVFFCSVPGHCPNGMALVVNPSGDMTLNTYLAGAKNATVVGPTTEGPEGGMLEVKGSNTTSSTMSSNNTTATPTATSTETSVPANTSGAAPAQTTTAAASGLHSSVALLAAVVAGVVAFAL